MKNREMDAEITGVWKERNYGQELRDMQKAREPKVESVGYRQASTAQTSNTTKFQTTIKIQTQTANTIKTYPSDDLPPETMIHKVAKLIVLLALMLLLIGYEVPVLMPFVAYFIVRTGFSLARTAYDML